MAFPQYPPPPLPLPPPSLANASWGWPFSSPPAASMVATPLAPFASEGWPCCDSCCLLHVCHPPHLQMRARGGPRAAIPLPLSSATPLARKREPGVPPNLHSHRLPVTHPLTRKCELGVALLLHPIASPLPNPLRGGPSRNPLLISPPPLPSRGWPFL